MGAVADQFTEDAGRRQRATPLPLMAERGRQEDYPVAAMGSLLGGAVEAVVDKAKVPVSIAAQSVLACCSLAVQGHVDVVLPTGQTRPTSLSLVSVAESGDRKSTSDDLVMKAIREHEQGLEERAAAERERSGHAQAAWDEHRKQVTNANKSKGIAALREAYEELGPRPAGPPEPVMIVRTGTTQGLLKRFQTTRPSLGLMSDEGGSWLGGYGMTEDNRLNTISTLSDFWDGKTIQTMTAGEGYTPLRGKRLAFHMMVQPIVAGRLLGDAEALGQGFLSRLLVAHPESIAGTRFIDLDAAPNPVHAAALDRFHAKIGAIVAIDLPVEPDTQCLKPKALGFSAEAGRMWFAFFNQIEKRLGADGDLRSVKGFVGKLPEQAARIAAILMVVEQGRSATEIGAEHLARAIELAEFYLGEALRLFGQAQPSVELQHAQLVSDWLNNKWKEDLVSVSILSQKGPNAIRQGADYVRKLIDTLVRHDHLAGPLPSGDTIAGTYQRTVWRVIRHG